MNLFTPVLPFDFVVNEALACYRSEGKSGTRKPERLAKYASRLQTKVQATLDTIYPWTTVLPMVYSIAA